MYPPLAAAAFVRSCSATRKRKHPRDPGARHPCKLRYPHPQRWHKAKAALTQFATPVKTGARAGTDLTDNRCIDAIAHILARARPHRKLAGIFCASGEVGAIRRKQGLIMVTLSHEGGNLTQTAKAQVAAAQREPPDGSVPAAPTGY